MMRIVTAALLAAFVGLLAARGGRAGANRAFGDQDRAGRAGRYVGPATPRDQARADLSARGMATARLSPIQSRPQCGARLHRDLCAGIPAERHRDYAAHELLLAARLVMRHGSALVIGISSQYPYHTLAVGSIATASAAAAPRSRRCRRRTHRARPTSARGATIGVHDRHGYRPQPRYYARPYYYRPYPYAVPAPFTFGFNFGPGWW